MCVIMRDLKRHKSESVENAIQSSNYLNKTSNNYGTSTVII